MPPKPKPIEERFLPHVERREDNECWPWTGCLNSHGYGAFAATVIGKKRSVKSHRVAYAISRGVSLDSIEGVQILHSCDNPPCCNPKHLREGTHADNMKDKAARGRAASDNWVAARPRGDQHHGRKTPEVVARGDRHGTKTKPHRIARGENVGGAKLTDELVSVCRLAHFRYKATQRSLAKRWKVSGIAMHNAIQGKTYSHLKEDHGIV